MRILFISNNFPPEVNAPATRLYEHARQWVRDGHDVEVLTSAPNFPEGRVYDGYENRFTTGEVDRIKVTRVPTYIAPNKGILRRTLSYVTYMASARWYARRLQQKPDVVVATSPQFFAGIAGYLMSRYQRVPFVLEIRDLWPESIVAVGALKRNAVIRFFERLERFLYERAEHIVVVTNAFKRFIVDKGIRPDKITVLKNGADLETWGAPLEAAKVAALRRRHGLDGKFVVSYIGTIGMAHRADVLLEAARRCPDPDVVFMVVGTGAERAALEARQAALGLPNFRLLGKVPKDEVRYLMALTDVSAVHLKASPLFKTVIPSKIFEAMASRTPIVLGVEGETKEILAEAGAGIPIEPENAGALVEAVLRLKREPALYARMAQSGYQHVHTHYDRSRLARRYAALLEQVAHQPHTINTPDALPVEMA
ncbi:MAG: glycosyltransferase family 4 protein [Rhodothermales bacterium]|nr:glycosyltransferase family 4 protein [Rhodothermales bacterium]